jgi:NAD(P)-dependent dehydrogenase (short-subunit alcohol dehydrogenase family)
VAVTYRSAREWDALAAAERSAVDSGRLLGVVCDVTQEPSVAKAVESVRNAYDDLRVLVHVAGGYSGGATVETVDERTVRGMMELNLLSAFWAAKHVVPHAKRSGRGRLLFVSSRGAIAADPGAAAYAASKAGLHALVSTLANELKRDGVTANAVLPSVMDTPGNRAAMPGASTADWVKTEAVADLLVYLASDGAAATSGALVPIYGRA